MAGIKTTSLNLHDGYLKGPWMQASCGFVIGMHIQGSTIIQLTSEVPPADALDVSLSLLIYGSGKSSQKPRDISGIA
ncbi:hypothetical protein N7468_009600 [Penicillium chermesinum]|uniref:Uncharacterized protein n=1 Tax=Penicillium chermesinum TaxID=63820 RepID=A0A9W9NI24_9EURO|nr:uncharacterized protein N7468_009600 [Penicillium chermesinum]KAJ5220396.1 hypothetical protein N7468_009600 [Penicillium chermesinum]KAJ6157836.1 hypothetical protein N7470_005428 [Penicillium chermesinum]